MKKLIICMAFFGMLIGNGNAATDNATKLSAALDTANVGDILDRLKDLNTCNNPTPTDAKAAMDDENIRYNNLKSKLDNKDTRGAVHTIIKYDDHERKYYLQNNDGFSKYVKGKLNGELQKINTYNDIIKKHGCTVYKQTNSDNWTDKIKGEETCLSESVDALKTKIGQLYNSMVNQIKARRQTLLQKLLEEKIKEHIDGLTICEQEEAVKQYAKDEVSKIIKGKGLDKQVAEFLEQEITDKLLDDAMNANKTVYEKKMDALLKAAPTRMVRTGAESARESDARLRYRLSKMRR